MSNITAKVFQSSAFKKYRAKQVKAVQGWLNNLMSTPSLSLKAPISNKNVGNASMAVAIDVLRTFGFTAGQNVERSNEIFVDVGKSPTYYLGFRCANVDNTSKQGVINQLRPEQEIDGVLVLYSAGVESHMWVILNQDLKEHYFDGEHGQHGGKSSKETAMGHIPPKDKWATKDKPFTYFLNINEFKKLIDKPVKSVA